MTKSQRGNKEIKKPKQAPGAHKPAAPALALPAVAPMTPEQKKRR
jgi:hypothetical protein